MPEISTIDTTPFDDQRPGTAGLRKKVSRVQTPHYLENFLQAIFNCADIGQGPLVIGGDGRYYNDQAIRICIAVALGNGIRDIIVGRDGLLSTPAASHVIRHYQARGGLVLSASHNPAGPKGDFGIKFNVANGGQASETLTEAIYQQSLKLSSYRIAEIPELDFSRIGEQPLNNGMLRVIDPVDDYAALMQRLFDFDQIADYLKSGARVAYDAMHAVTGPYARRLFVDMLGADPDSLMNCQPLADFGGGHPDPNLKYAKALVKLLMADDGPDLGAASDGDGDRNMILGRGIFVSPGDSLAVLADNLSLCPGYHKGLQGVARSMPTSRAVDIVARENGLALHETPTGWRFFCNLLDAGKITLCGEESFGTGSNHVREKDGLWAVLAWLNILAARRQSVAEIMQQHWGRYGRHYYQRHDYEGLPQEQADALVGALRSNLGNIVGGELEGQPVTLADEFDYHDPVDGSLSRGQGIRVLFGDQARLVVRLSGTGTAGATLRLYFERYAASNFEQPPEQALASLVNWATSALDLNRHLGRSEPDVVT